MSSKRDKGRDSGDDDTTMLGGSTASSSTSSGTSTKASTTKEEDAQVITGSGLVQGASLSTMRQPTKREQEEADKAQKDNENPGEKQRKEQDELEKRLHLHPAVTIDEHNRLIMDRAVDEEEKKATEEREKKAKESWKREQDLVQKYGQVPRSEIGKAQEERKD